MHVNELVISNNASRHSTRKIFGHLNPSSNVVFTVVAKLVSTM